MAAEDNPADEISEEEYYRGMVEAAGHWTCASCNYMNSGPVCTKCWKSKEGL